MEERFAEFRAEIRLGQEDAAAKALKLARYEKPYEYKRKSNQDQAAFNAKVDEAVAEAEHQIEEAGSSTVTMECDLMCHLLHRSRRRPSAAGILLRHDL